MKRVSLYLHMQLEVILEDNLLGLTIFLMSNLKCVVFTYTCFKQKYGLAK